MKMLENGVLRDMTQEEISQMETANAEMLKLIPPNNERETLEEVIVEFIDRLAEANTILDIIAIAKDIKSRKGRSA